MNARTKERADRATEKAAQWLHLANLASEKGDHVKAEKLYGKAQHWQDRMNHYLGNGDGSYEASVNDLVNSGGLIDAP